MEKRKRKETRKPRKSLMKNSLTIEAKRNLIFLGIDNCLLIYLSPQTQRYIGCQIGEHITAEEPWVYVKKEKIEDLIFLHENSSEFYPIRSKIEKYPEEMMLIGSYRTSQVKIEEFLLCTTIQAKLKILEVLDKEKEALIAKVIKLLYCQPREWNSLGSEVEVDGSQNKNNRHLFEVIIDSKIPITIGIGKVKFNFRLASVNPKTRTYHEFVSDSRFTKKFILQVRIDKACQISPEQKNFESQTVLPYPIHKLTQTDEKFGVLKLTEPQNQKLNKGLNNLIKFLEDTLLVNFHINLYNHDYEFPNAYKQSLPRHSKELMTFQDVVNCKDLFHGSVSWNALISGLIAVSYVERPLKLIVNERFNANKRITSHKLHEGSTVLLWCYNDSITPKLHIHVNFEITSISFCPYDENILVGGGSSGQIVIWDLTNKIKQVEAKEYLTTIELNHRNLVRAHTTWMKWPPGVRHVFPTIISDLAASHKSPVVNIQWLPSYQCLTKLGHIENLPNENDNYKQPTKSYQFLTCSMEDSVVLAWEIKQSSHMVRPEKPNRKKHRRLSRVPDYLNKGVSPLKMYNRNFQPFFKLKLELPGAKEKRIFVTDFVLNNPNIDYVAFNPKTMDNVRERTFFKDIVPNELKEHKQKFVFCSTSGYLAESKWTMNEFDQGQKMNERVCDTKVFLAVHDGPIYSCRSNCFNPECILTVGGSVFAVWLTTANKKPVFWRKGSCRYTGGIWSRQYPLICMILREDSFIEYWDLIAARPLRFTKLKGSQVIDVIVDSTKGHARKSTYILADAKGALRVQDRAIFATLLSEEEMKDITLNVLNHMLRRMKHVENLNERLKKNYNFSDINVFTRNTFTEKQPTATKSEFFDHQKHLIEMQNRFCATKWQQQEEVRMYETLLQQKRINIEELQQNTIPLLEKLNKRLEQQKKINQRLAMKEEIFDNHKKFLLGIAHIPRRRKISVSFPLEMEKIIKDGYMEDYKIIEQETLESLTKVGIRHSDQWLDILGKRKTVYSTIKKNQKFISQISFLNRRQTITFDRYE